jgi:hypothetical protein
MEKTRDFICICGTKDRISLGIVWMGPFNMIVSALVILVGLAAALHPQYRGSGIAIILLLAGIQAFHYTNIYRDMIKQRHTSACSARCAREGMWYQAVGSSYHIYAPRSSKTKKR